MYPSNFVLYTGMLLKLGAFNIQADFYEINVLTKGKYFHPSIVILSVVIGYITVTRYCKPTFIRYDFFGELHEINSVEAIGI